MQPSVPDSEDLPEALCAYDQWLCWREEQRDGKATKIPIDPETGSFASTTDPDTWAAFETAREQVQFGDEDGVGFVFTDNDPIVGVDLDDCRIPETGNTKPWAEDVIETLDSFTEISPSGTGFHILVKGDLPDGRNRKDDLEMYETARFFTVTADHVEGTPTDLRERTGALHTVYDEYIVPEETETAANDAPESTASRNLNDDKLLQKAKAASNGEKFERLWRGSTSGYESHSEADMALCSLLAFWTGGDAQQIDRLFRDSGLMREKWDEQHFADGSTYGEKTVERAVAGTSEFYEPSGEQRDTVEEQDVEQSVDSASVRERERERLQRIDELQKRLNEVLEEKRELADELEAERERRRELESELEAAREENQGLFGWRG